MSAQHWVALLLISFTIACLADLMTVRRVPGGLFGFFVVAFFGGVVAFWSSGPFAAGKIYKFFLEAIGGSVSVQIYRWIRWEL